MYIADATFGWALEVAEKMGIKRAAVSLAEAGNLAFALHIPKLIEDGIIDAEGNIYLLLTIQLFSVTKIDLIYMLMP